MEGTRESAYMIACVYFVPSKSVQLRYIGLFFFFFKGSVNIALNKLCLYASVFFKVLCKDHMHQNYLGCILKCRFLGEFKGFRVSSPGI